MTNNNHVEAWITTTSNKQFVFENPSPESLDIKDIAHALSLICRFTGHCSRFYSVAEHSVRVSEWAEERFGKEYAREGLMHDSSEAYVTDVNGPLKRLIGEPYTRLEDKALVALGKKFNFSPIKSDAIRQCDGGLYLAERRDLFPPCDLPFITHTEKQPYPFVIWGWSPAEAKEKFLNRYEKVKSW
jgi:uncharacterized protein